MCYMSVGYIIFCIYLKGSEYGKEAGGLTTVFIYFILLFCEQHFELMTRPQVSFIYEFINQQSIPFGTLNG